MAGEVVTRLREVVDGEDRYGNPMSTVQESDIPGGFFAPEQASREPVEVGRQSVVTQPTVYFPGSWPDVTARDQLRVRGRVFAVDGDPADWKSPWGTGLGGLVVTLKAVEG